jgi:phosphatidylethanolamine-binding protein (PEBP) family uncharacterized protein
VAQRTGAKRFLAPPAASASARVALALAGAALLLSGCGGGSADQENSASTASSSADAGAPATESPSSAQAAKGTPAAKSKAASAASSQGGQKRGQPIAPPKGPREPEPSAAEIANATVADITLQSPAIHASAGNPGSLSPTYSCDGKDSWPAFSWSGVPAGTAELALYAMNVQPVAGKLFIDWAVAGLDPELEAIEAGKLPKGAVVGQNSFGKRGYELCPTGSGEIYMFALYALPHRLGLSAGFDAHEARAQILAISANVGLLPALYAHS